MEKTETKQLITLKKETLDIATSLLGKQPYHLVKELIFLIQKDYTENNPKGSDGVNPILSDVSLKPLINYLSRLPFSEVFDVLEKLDREILESIQKNNIKKNVVSAAEDAETEKSNKKTR